MFSLLFLLKDIFLVPCAKAEDVFCSQRKSSISKRLLLLCLLTGAELIITVLSFDEVTEMIWPWRSEAIRIQSKDLVGS